MRLAVVLRGIFPGLFALLAVACTHVREDVRTPDLEGSREGARAFTPADDRPLPTARPRLSRTITLGRGADEAYAPARAAPSPAPVAPSVTVTQQVVVQTAPPVYGYGYGYGYGSPRAPAIGAPSRVAPDVGRWDGPRATAAPGQTPGVAGNWAPAPSYGPATMK